MCDSHVVLCVTGGVVCDCHVVLCATETWCCV